MADPPGENDRLSELQLIDATRRQGHKVTHDRLKGWRTVGLIPRPDQTHPSGRRGSESTYPPGTLGQVLAVCELRSRFRKLDRIGFELWWAGDHASNIAHVRDFLTGELERSLGPLREHRDKFDDPFDAAEAAVNGPISATRDPAMRAMWRLAKTDENLRSALFACLMTVFGGEPAWDLEDPDDEDPEPPLRELVDRVFGVQRMATDPLDNGMTLWPADVSLAEAFSLVINERVIDLDDPGWAVRCATDAELEYARLNARILIIGLGAFARLEGVRFGRDYAGLSVLASVTASEPRFVAFVVQLCLCLPTLYPAPEDNIEVAHNIDEIASNEQKFRCVELLLKEYPNYAFLFKPDGEMRRRSYSRDEQEMIRLTLTEFLTRHPECDSLLSLEE